MTSNPVRASACLVAFFLTACSNPGQVTLARPQPKGHTMQALSSGYSGTATFDVPVVDPNTWQGNPMGTGSWSTTATPPLSGGPTGVGFYESQAGHYLMIGNFSASGTFFGIVSDGAQLTLGASQVNNTTLYAGIFDAATGDPVALATSGTITLTANGLIGGRITGTFTGTLDDVTPSPLCTTTAQCRPGETCLGGKCVVSGCTSNAQCATGQICQGGQCISNPGCTSNAQCGAGLICQGGQCVAPPACTSNAQCAAGKVCQAGQCVTAPPACTTDAQCGSGKKCQAGQCVSVTPISCNGLQGDGAYAGALTNSAVCSAFNRSSVNVTKAFAVLGDDGNGLTLFVMDPASDSAGAVIPLAACPSGLGTVNVSGASFWDQTTSGGVAYYSNRPATLGTITVTQVGAAGLKGNFWLSLVDGSEVKGSFDVR